MSTFPPQDPTLLRASPLVEDCSNYFVFKLFPYRLHCKEGPPVTGRLINLRRYWMSQKSGKGDVLRKEKGVFAYFCRRMDKSKASGSTRTAGFVFQKKVEGSKTTLCCPELLRNPPAGQKKTNPTTCEVRLSFESPGHLRPGLYLLGTAGYDQVTC